LVNLKVKV